MLFVDLCIFFPFFIVAYYCLSVYVYLVKSNIFISKERSEKKLYIGLYILDCLICLLANSVSFCFKWKVRVIATTLFAI